jgi:purine catabolism regulator
MAPIPSGLKEILRIAIEEPVQWITGETDAENPINWFTNSIEDIKEGDVLLTQEDGCSAHLLNLAGNKLAAGVLIIGESEPSIQWEAYDFPILLIPSEEDITKITRGLQRAVLNQQAAVMQRGLRVHTQLSELVAQGAGLAGLARAMGDISGCGVLVQDKRARILAQQGSGTLRGIWDVILEHLSALNSLPESLLDRKRAGVQSGTVMQSIPGELFRLVNPITVSSVVRGYLSLVGTQAELDPLAHIVVDQGSIVCAIEMARKKAIRETEKRLKGDLLTALLGDNISPRDAELWVDTMGLDLDLAHIALRFMWDGEGQPSRRRLETLVNGEISRRDTHAIVNPLGLEVVCFCQVEREAGRPERALELGRLVIEQGKEEYPEGQIRCGVGSSVTELSEWRDSFRQAGQALAMARRFEGVKPLYFPDLSVYRLLMQIEHNPELITFQEETLGPLTSHENCPEMVRTLGAYFEHNGNISKTAESLFIHRNTLLYRLERISSILDLDLENPDNRLAIQLALRIQQMKGLC